MTGQRTSRAALAAILIAGGLTAAFAATVLVRSHAGVDSLVRAELQAWAHRHDATLQVATVSAAGFTGIRLDDVFLEEARDSLKVQARLDHLRVYPSIDGLLRGRLAVGELIAEQGRVHVSPASNAHRDRPEPPAKRPDGPAGSRPTSARSSSDPGEPLPLDITLRNIDVTAESQSPRLQLRATLIERVDLTVRAPKHPRFGGLRGYGRLPDGVAFSVASRPVSESDAESLVLDTAAPTRISAWVRAPSQTLERADAWLSDLILTSHDRGLQLCGRRLRVSAYTNASTVEARAPRACLHRAGAEVGFSVPTVEFESPSFDGAYTLEGLSGAYVPGAAEATLEASLLDDRGGRALLEARRRTSGDVHIDLKTEEFEPHGLLKLSGLDRWFEIGRLGGDVEARVQPPRGRGTIDGNLRLEDSILRHPLVGPEPLRIDKHVEIDWRAIADWRHMAFSLPRADVRLASLRPFEVSGSAVAADPGWSFWVQGHGTNLRAPTLRDVLPTTLVAPAMGAELRGTFDLSVYAAGHTGYPESLQLDVDVGGEVEVLAESPRSDIPSLALTGPPMPGTTPRRLPLLEPTGWTHLDGLPDSLPRVIVAAEDSRFFEHAGFSWRGIRNALVYNLRNDELQRGGSTITQQLAKNLFLSRQRTLSRKIQELWVAWRLESELSKRRILELYLNLVDWGPGIRGLGQAARHYFEVSPSDLSLEQMTLLAAILPGPVLYGELIDAGYLPSSRVEKIDHILSNLAYWGIVTDRERAKISKRARRGELGGLDLTVCRDQATASKTLPTC
jgi:hypothetical protein